MRGYGFGRFITIALNVHRDLTPPIVSPNLEETPGTDGWYTSDVGLTWSVSDPDSEVTSSSGCVPTTVTTDACSRC